MIRDGGGALHPITGETYLTDLVNNIKGLQVATLLTFNQFQQFINQSLYLQGRGFVSSWINNTRKDAQ